MDIDRTLTVTVMMIHLIVFDKIKIEIFLSRVLKMMYILLLSFQIQFLMPTYKIFDFLFVYLIYNSVLSLSFVVVVVVVVFAVVVVVFVVVFVFVVVVVFV